MLFNQINPYQQGYLQVDEIHQIYYEVSGNPNGLPILYLHGGPGGSFSPQTRQLFDPSIYKIILFDQRGAGKSLPFAELKNNTTFYLVSDIEKLREHLKIDQWVIFGGSWGTTLGLVYAINHPQKVLAMLLRGVFLAREEDVDFLYEENGASIFAPDYFAEYQNFINKHNPGSDKILNRYYQLFINPTIPEELRKLAIKNLVIEKALLSVFRNLRKNHIKVESIKLLYLKVIILLIKVFYQATITFLKIQTKLNTYQFLSLMEDKILIQDQFKLGQKKLTIYQIG
ncbi:Proline iminopeptidase (plasmid) [Mycoplasmopsis gallopavonis]|uniref:prolyl aminopeptidase n=1 Tax=Mycoplasmopsis gallopavonis TaxID=76629 RepID=A0A449B092_9BACT|nr:alpha/beta fold hydrolase [Mycoplasmopsis gallopavonis]VEU73211.1 Proline iminopeptidase [Mycoplasmopsis gallopavonis]